MAALKNPLVKDNGTADVPTKTLNGESASGYQTHIKESRPLQIISVIGAGLLFLLWLSLILRPWNW